MIRVKEVAVGDDVIPVLVVDEPSIMEDWVFIDVFVKQLKKAGVDPELVCVADFEDEYEHGTRVYYYYWAWYIVESQGKYYVVEYREKEVTIQRHGIIETYRNNAAKIIKVFGTLEEAYDFINKRVEQKSRARGWLRRDSGSA